MLDNILTKETRILILEDSYPDANLMEIVLSDADIPYISQRVETRGEFIAAIQDFSPDLILADYHLPAFNGLDALTLAQQTCPDAPFIIVTGALGEERAVECIKNGATDFLLKDNMSRLPQAVLRALREGREKFKRKKAERERKRLTDILEATTDFVGISDSKGQLVYINQMWRVMLGLGPEDSIEGLKLEDFHPPQSSKILLNEVLPKAAEKGMWSWETVMLNKQDEEIPVSQVLIAHKRLTGEVEFFSTIVRDITDLKEAKDRAIRAIVKGEDQERKRIAREIHDSLGQTLTAASLNLDAIKQDLSGLNDRTNQLFQTAFQLINSAIRESREISHNLMPKVIEDFGLIPALENLLNKIQQVTEIELVFYHNVCTQRLDYDIELNLFRITQEAINNILKHAQASKVSIQLIEYEGELIYTIEDDGKGFEVEATKKDSAGIGLMSIKNRVVSIGGKLSIESAPDKGTVIAIEVKYSHYVEAK